ncbi:hypothetical protein AB0I28_04440 [Phytomonospora sp. NPDC050363]|uniref:serine/threonine protein kinase n=1 Tax=Phytomonospora sp. NPDC050363 TaxID=3155642 RepID=UPI0033E6E217
MDGFQIIRWLSSDDSAAVYEAAGPGGRRLIYTVGHRPVEPGGEFSAWAQRLRGVRHPHLVAVAAAGLTDDSRPYVLCGTGSTTLAERLVRTPPSVTEVVRTTTAIADALDTAHAAGLRHGTICPSTVVYAVDGTPMLTGFDMCAPSLVKTARPGLYTVPELDPGYPADIYALAATAYVALGGTLPYVGDPTDPALRRRGITELPGVPPELTGMLRTALNPDPSARPSAALLRDALSTVDIAESPPTVALPVTVVGSDVRAANKGVAPINEAVTGTQPRIPREKRPPMPAGVAPLPSTGAKPKRTYSGRVLVVFIVLLVLAGGLGGAWMLRDEFADATEDRSAEIERVDFDAVEFTVPYDAAREVKLKGGTGTGVGSGEGAPTETWTLVTGPVFADGNHNGDQDTAAIHLTVTTENGTRAYVLVFYWSDGLRQAGQVVNGICEVRDMRPSGPSFELELVSANPFVNCEAVKESDRRYETIGVQMSGGLLIQAGPHIGAASRCEPTPGVETEDHGADTIVRVAPTSEAMEVGDGIESVTVFRPETAGTVEWLLAYVSRSDGTATCGWVAAADVA